MLFYVVAYLSSDYPMFGIVYIYIYVWERALCEREPCVRESPALHHSIICSCLSFFGLSHVCLLHFGQDAASLHRLLDVFALLLYCILFFLKASVFFTLSSRYCVITSPAGCIFISVLILVFQQSDISLKLWSKCCFTTTPASFISFFSIFFLLLYDKCIYR